MNSQYISIIALVVGVFFSGAYLRGESARKQDIKREIDAIRARQTEIMAAVTDIHRSAAVQDSLLRGQIAQASEVIEQLDKRRGLSDQEIASLGTTIDASQKDLEANVALLESPSSMSFTAPAVPIVASEN